MIISQSANMPTYSCTSADDRVAQPSISPPVFRPAAVSRDGRVVVNHQDVYDTDTWTLLGKAVDPLGSEAQISPDGSKVYLVVLQSVPASSYTIVHIDVFDTSTVVAGATNFVKLGSRSRTSRSVRARWRAFRCRCF